MENCYQTPDQKIVSSKFINPLREEISFLKGFLHITKETVSKTVSFAV